MEADLNSVLTEIEMSYTQSASSTSIPSERNDKEEPQGDSELLNNRIRVPVNYTYSKERNTLIDITSMEVEENEEYNEDIVYEYRKALRTVKECGYRMEESKFVSSVLKPILEPACMMPLSH